MGGKEEREGGDGVEGVGRRRREKVWEGRRWEGERREKQKGGEKGREGGEAKERKGEKGREG